LVVMSSWIGKIRFGKKVSAYETDVKRDTYFKLSDEL